MNTSLITSQRNSFCIILIMLVILVAVGVAGYSAVASPALGLADVNNAPAQDLSHAYAIIPKPTYTPQPTITPQPTATDIPPVISDSIIRAEIVNDNSPNSGNVPPEYNGGKYILVDISEQHMYVFDGENQVFSFVVSTGMGNSTRIGRFSVLDKIPNAYGATWNIWMPNWLGIYYSGYLENGIHALPILSNGATLWEGYLGTPISYGCVVLGTYEAQQLYDWAEVGVPVEIQR